MISIVDRKKRLELHLPVMVKGIDEGGHAFDEATRTRNISAGGICFESGRHLPMGGRVDLEIAIPAASQVRPRRADTGSGWPSHVKLLRRIKVRSLSKVN